MKEVCCIEKIIDEENGVYLSIERNGDIIGVSLMTRIDDDLIECGNTLLNLFFFFDPDVFDDEYKIVGNEFVYTLYLSVHCRDNKDTIFELVSNHFYAILKGIKESKTREYKKLCDQIYKDMFLSDCVYLTDNELFE